MPFAGSENKLEPEFADNFNKWKAAPSPTTSGALLKTVSPVIDSAMRSFGGASQKSPTLRSKARKLALDALPTYDPAKGKLRTHLLSNLQRLHRLGAREQNIISVPEQVVMDRKHLVETEDALRERLGRDPSDYEISDATGLSFKRLSHIRGANVPLAEGTAAQGMTPGEEGNMPAAVLPGAGMGDEWADFIYYDLGPTDKAIMDYMLGRNGTPKLSATETAARVGLSVGAVSQRTSRIQQKLDERDELGLF